MVKRLMDVHHHVFRRCLEHVWSSGTLGDEGGGRAPGGARHGGGNRAVNSQPRTGQSTSYGDVKSSYEGGGGRRVGQEGVRDMGTQERHQTGGGATQTHRMREPHLEGQGRAQQTRRRGTARQ